MMQLNMVPMIFICILLCLSLNYTFPLHRENIKEPSPDASFAYPNNSWHWEDFHHGIVERSKKMASNIENAIKKIKNSATDLGRNIYYENGVKRENNKLSEEDLRQYEQLVIMKKYPYLDFKELEYRYSPWSNKNKNVRQSWRIEPESHLRDSILYEPDESINVEIMNRGLSGFSIPPKLVKATVDNTLKDKKEKDIEQRSDSIVKLSRKSSRQVNLDDFEKNIIEYEMR